MNKLRFSWAALSLLAPILIFCALCLGPAACSGGNGSSAALPSPTNANVQVAFISTLTASSSLPPNFLQSLQNFVVNVTGVRMNPLPTASGAPTPSETNGKWVVIPVPSATATGSGSGVVPFDVISGQSQMQVFNTLGVNARKFVTIELVLDTTQPGYIVPQCAGENLEGCVRYPVQLENPTFPLQFQLSEPLQTKEQQTMLLPVQISANVVSTPTGPGQPYLVGLKASNPSNISAYVGTVTGTVKGAKGATSKQGERLHVTAELAGTNTIVAASNVSTTSGTYMLFLPATAVGTLYDLYVSGSNTTIEAQRGVSSATSTPERLSPGATATVDFNEVKGGQTIGGFSGSITDSCTTLPITGATVQILVPNDANTTIDCASTPSECISVASATSDSSGGYPIPGNQFAPAPFEQIPIGSPTATYVLEISAPGYDTLFMEGTAAQGGSGAGVAAGHCFTPTAMPSATPSNGTCSFALTTGYLQGTVKLTAAQPPGTTTTVQVMAEDTGTNNLVAALTTPLTISGGGTSLGFTLNVPSHLFNRSGRQDLDVFAVSQDLYQGGPDPFPGHTIIVQQNVSGPPTACATVSASSTGLFTESMDCVGHASISGIAVNNPSDPDNNTTIELYKNGVALTDSPVTIVAPTAQASAAYNFCIPPDSYTLQRFEGSSPAGPTMTVGPMATPASTTTPCPSTCFNGTGTCPGICRSTQGPTM